MEMALLCTRLPMPNEAQTVNMQKSTANHFACSPRSKAYMGPPAILPVGLRTRYFTASNPSAYFVAMPNTPVSQHQNTAPGPPSVMAVATPMMLPVPMVAARAVANAPNWLTSPFADESDLTDRRMAVSSLRCGNRNRMVMNTWVPSRMMTMGHPQRKSLHDLMSALRDSMTCRLRVVRPLRGCSHRRGGKFRGRYV